MNELLKPVSYYRDMKNILFKIDSYEIRTNIGWIDEMEMSVQDSKGVIVGYVIDLNTPRQRFQPGTYFNGYYAPHDPGLFHHFENWNLV